MRTRRDRVGSASLARRTAGEGGGGARARAASLRDVRRFPRRCMAGRRPNDYTTRRRVDARDNGGDLRASGSSARG